jgi:hypothetical protein
MESEQAAKITAHTDRVTREKLESLAKRDDTVVYVYKNDTATYTMDPEEQQHLYKVIIESFDVQCTRHPDECDEALRERVLNISDRVRLFQNLYAYVFAKSTRRVYSAEDEESLDKFRKGVLVALRAKIDKRDDHKGAEASALAQCLGLAMRDSRPGDEGATQLELPQETIKAAEEAAGASMPTQIHRLELGPSTVLQGQLHSHPKRL